MKSPNIRHIEQRRGMLGDILSGATASVAVETAFLSLAVWITSTSGVGGVGPLTLNLPLRAIAERHEWNVEGPGALVAVFGSLPVTPGTGIVGIAASFRQLVTT